MIKLLVILLFLFSTAYGQDVFYFKGKFVNPANQAPVANAGIDQAIIYPASSVTLTGSWIDYDGTVVTHTWVQTSGPVLANNSYPDSSITNITWLVPGTYIFTLVVIDNLGAIGADEVEIIVNPSVNVPPTVSAGSNLSITLPDNDTTLVAVGTDTDGTISSYLWNLESGPNAPTIGTAGAASTTVSNLIEGTYIFRVTVTDDDNATGYTTVQVIVHSATPPPNLNPIANAGADIIINL